MEKYPSIRDNEYYFMSHSSYASINSWLSIPQIIFDNENYSLNVSYYNHNIVIKKESFSEGSAPTPTGAISVKIDKEICSTLYCEDDGSKKHDIFLHRQFDELTKMMINIKRSFFIRFSQQRKVEVHYIGSKDCRYFFIRVIPDKKSSSIFIGFYFYVI
jgi:hypothetical protein